MCLFVTKFVYLLIHAADCNFTHSTENNAFDYMAAGRGKHVTLEFFMSAFVCVLSYVCFAMCSQMCAFICLLLYVSSHMCALLCVLFSVLSYVCFHLCALLCVLICVL